jgi:hypothetical protein
VIRNSIVTPRSNFNVFDLDHHFSYVVCTIQAAQWGMVCLPTAKYSSMLRRTHQLYSCRQVKWFSGCRILWVNKAFWLIYFLALATALKKLFRNTTLDACPFVALWPCPKFWKIRILVKIPCLGREDHKNHIHDKIIKSRFWIKPSLKLLRGMKRFCWCV